jgi:3-hexulose-6-phosphate synthase
MGDDYICVHTASDVKEKEAPPLEELKKIKKGLMNAQIAIAGGIDDHFAEAIVKEKPEIIVVGSYITKSPNPREAALILKNIMPSD